MDMLTDRWKAIVIGSCRECKFCYNRLGKPACMIVSDPDNHSEMKDWLGGRYLDNPEGWGFPEWCPLKDYDMLSHSPMKGDKE